MASTQSSLIPSVQELIAKQPMAAVPHPFLLDDHQDLPVDLPNSTSMAAIPTIDFKLLNMTETTDFELQKLHLTCKEWGVFQVFFINLQSVLFFYLINLINIALQLLGLFFGCHESQAPECRQRKRNMEDLQNYSDTIMHVN